LGTDILKLYTSYRGDRFQVPTRLTTVTRQIGEYKVDATRHPKFSLAFGERCYQTWPPQVILFSDWLISKKSSPLKPLGQMNQNLVGSIYGRSSINIAHFVPIGLQTWQPQAILVYDWLISKISSVESFGFD
jgi:hypothetical protein